MATEAIEQEAEIEAVPASKKTRGVLLLALGGIIAGVGAGVFALGPLLTKHATAKPVAAGAADLAKSETRVVHEVANLVLNPAGTGGTRFLMVTATFQLKDAATDQLFKDHEPEVRDRILSVLGKQTVDELTDMSHRDIVKRQLIDSVGVLFPKGAILNLFFPQFVIQ